MRRAYFRAMRALMIGAALLAGCGPKPQDPCTRFFEPYPDLVSSRSRTEQNASLLDAMADYSAGRYEAALAGLQACAKADAAHSDVPYMYSASAYLALGKPYEAELQLDFLKRHYLKTFRDEVDWYYALCWLCSDQQDRALEQARRIAALPRHTYKPQAQALIEALSR